LGSILWRESIWHGYFKKVACERRHEVAKVYHDSINWYLWNDMV
jgi:hypothetical protein